jgi:transcriptional regulator with XRE-family HTH domain
MIDDLYTEMGTRIKKLRTEKKLTRERLAEKAEISTQFLADIETGNKGMSAATLYKLSRALCVSSDYLLFGNENDECGIADVIKAIPDRYQTDAAALLTVFANAVNS